MANLADAVLAYGEWTPNAIAVQTAGSVLTYSELAQAARRARSAMAARGLGPGAVVGIATRDGPTAIMTMLGAWLLGGTAMLMDFRKPALERQAAADRFGCALFVEDRAMTGARCPVLEVASWKAEIAGADPDDAPAASDAHPAFIALSSGTTGAPTAIAQDHTNMFARQALWGDSMVRHLYRRYLCASPLAFAGTIGWVNNTLLAGGTIVFFPSLFRPSDLLDALERYEITGCALVPTVLRDLLVHAEQNGQSLAHLHERLWLVTHGASIQPAEIAEIRTHLTPNLLQVYGGLATGPVAYVNLGEEPESADTVGRIFPGVRVEIVDDSDTPLPAGRVGRMRISSPGLGRPLGGGESAFRDGWYYPGDLGILDARGYLKLMGREGEVIVRGGVNVFLQEVEAVLSGVPGIKEVAAVGIRDARLGEDLALFAIADLDATEIGRIFREQASASHCPGHIEVISAMPLNANGKIDKRALAARLSAG